MSKLTSKIFPCLKGNDFRCRSGVVTGLLLRRTSVLLGTGALRLWARRPHTRTAAPPAYVYGRPPVVGDYDEHHTWHERDWWIRNNHPWVQQHHPEWMAHEHGHENDNAHR